MHINTLKRCFCLLLAAVMLLGTLPASAVELSGVDLQQRLENNRERYNNFIAVDPQIFLYPNRLQEAFTLSDDEYEYIRDLTFDLTADCNTVDDKIFAVAEYIATNVCYDVSIRNVHPYYVLQGGPTTCAGYSNAFNVMMQILGNPCVNVSSPNHDWNLVYTGARWMLVDVTWCSAGYVENGELVKGEVMSTTWYDFPLEWTNESKDHYIDMLPYSKVGGVFQNFPEYTEVTSFTVPNDVTSIGASAFDFCKYLTSVTIPGSVTKIGESAFADCSSLAHVNIPDSVTEIGEKAFSCCYALTSVDLPDSITTIPYRAFEFSSLTEITIPGSVTSIGIGAFSDNLELKSVTIPKSVTGIGENAFHRCNDLADVYYEGSEADWQKISIGSGNHALTNAIIYFDTDAGSKDEAGLSGTFGKGLAWNFTNGTLTVSGSGEMPAYHYGTGDNPPWYEWLDRIESIVIKPGVTYVSKAFEYADNLKEVRVEEGVETIAWCAFYYCPALETVTLPKSLKSIEFDAFYGCDSLKTVYYQGSESQWNEIEWPTMEGDGEPHFLSSTRIVFLGTDSESDEKTDADPCAQGHSWGGWQTDAPATCTATGRSVRSCLTCGEKEVRDIPAAGHKYTSQETKDSVIYTCPVCGDQYTEAKEQDDRFDPTGEALDNFEKAYAYTTGTFVDIQTNHWFFDNVKIAYEYGLMNGVGNDSFLPHGNITLSQAVTMAARLHNIYYSNGASFDLSDGDQWYTPYVEYAESAGILIRSFDYDQFATREQFVYILSRALPAEVLPDVRGTVSFADSHDINYNDEVELLVRAGVINGSNRENGLCFLPLKTISRAEAAAIMSRMILPGMRSAS